MYPPFCPITLLDHRKSKGLCASELIQIPDRVVSNCNRRSLTQFVPIFACVLCNVRSLGKSGRLLLMLSVSQFDPIRTSRTILGRRTFLVLECA
jgi:hypothetical protein